MLFKIIITIRNAHKQALDKIRENDYSNYSISSIFEDFIEDYLLREKGKLGYIEDYLTKEQIKPNYKENSMEKPPLGLMPKNLHDEQRAIEILAAMDRYVRANKQIPREWLDELLNIHCITPDETT